MEAVVVTKEAQARNIVNNYMMGNAAVGLLPLPLFDLLALAGVQLKMVHSLSNLYEVPFKADVVKASLFSMLGSLNAMTLGVGLAVSALKFLPGAALTVGVLALPASSAALTYAVGKVFIMHFESGGTLLDFDAKKMHEYFRQSFQDGLAIKKEQIVVVPPAPKQQAVVVVADKEAAFVATEKVAPAEKLDAKK